MSEGYVKFSSELIQRELKKDISELNSWRDRFYALRLIGKYDNGIGYGNISVRSGRGFVISGTKTGGIEKLTKEHYTEVIHWDFDENYLVCAGEIDASSESLTHAAVYESDLKINSVIHVHNLELWEKWKGKLPTTSELVEYGTPKMAEEISRLFRETDVKEKKILIMGGHKEGIISFGKDLDEAGNILLNYF